ncbi:MAG: 50S ribosomal protein L17 [Phycisphaerales bacterium JB063]
MRHRVAGRILGRKTNHRRAMFRNMAVSLFTHGQITTTVPKAKAVRPFVEKLITAAKKGDLHARRRVITKLGGDQVMVKHDNDDDVVRNKYGEVIGGPKVVKHLFEEIAPQYADRTGGYTRIIRIGKHRIGDASDLCVLQLVRAEDDGPKLAGERPRRAKSNKRMEFAAKLAKNHKKADKPAKEEPAAEAAEETESAE